jgi:hypothetical protein
MVITRTRCDRERDGGCGSTATGWRTEPHPRFPKNANQEYRISYLASPYTTSAYGVNHGAFADAFTLPQTHMSVSGVVVEGKSRSVDSKFAILPPHYASKRRADQLRRMYPLVSRLLRVGLQHIMSSRLAF